eukprot:CAMPEP_0182456332 /NCGR_PEP_ID=MMETSP1319-20130603/2194_1 /TAXON_ID=172717 /ORGANISM="Bolidomonas pacifica, Strain RCC208" /LENGTH=284 /DNA_ID=CAMNT_0024654549 /DNA_START=334 /DNA_END=1185 /DNA_ORIENTATION=+
MSDVPSSSVTDSSRLLDASFSSAATFASSLSSLDKATQQSIYGLYKCSTVGCPPKNRPSVFDVVGRAKWDGWSSKYNHFKGDKDAAKRAYIDLIVKVSKGTFKPKNYDDYDDDANQDKAEKMMHPIEDKYDDEPRRLNLSQTSPERYWLLSTLETRTSLHLLPSSPPPTSSPPSCAVLYLCHRVSPSAAAAGVCEESLSSRLRSLSLHACGSRCYAVVDLVFDDGGSAPSSASKACQDAASRLIRGHVTALEGVAVCYSLDGRCAPGLALLVDGKIEHLPPSPE